MIATKRARQIAMGATPLVEEQNDKPTVLALREIAEGKIDASILDEPPEETPVDALLGEEEPAQETEAVSETRSTPE